MAVINIGSGSVKLYQSSTKSVLTAVTLLAAGGKKATLEAVTFFYNKAKEHGEKVCIFGTESMRQNGGELKKQILDSLGLEVDIIDGKTEALCGFLGSGADQNSAVLDVGGASTELSTFDSSLSLAIGAVDLYNRFPLASSPQNENSVLEKMFGYIDNVLIDLPCLNTKNLILIGGSALNLSAVAGKYTEFDPDKLDKSWIFCQNLLDIIRLLFSLSVEQRVAKYPFLDSGRAAVLPYGASIIFAAMRRFSVTKARVSKAGLIEGYIKLKNLK